ncbi:FAD-dependent oxidoreductase [Pandoraea sp.]|uniref:FAD-dependent oxidoreductase n=1 Tax=Pandoraea sp. TaxID=1883445 RepID=UPI0011FD18D5|nr:FAD-dependent oxidoreductase [Pandoraea sp.]TAL56365.1 MAG: FAD-dependent oxidoreductase [Pandoraea sp.]TAM20006.1 MAG: FAD-dependent oxidoreductase [Pandoraea sp.]
MILYFDILIIGAGPAGLSAATVAAGCGARVGIIDDNPLPGGQIWRQGPDHPPGGSARALLAELAGHPNVTRLSGTRVVQSLGPGRLLAEDAQHGLTLGYGKLILATGARERFLPFPGWTLPGVTGAGGLQALVKGGVPVRGQRVVMAGSGPLLWAAAASARAQGARIVAIVEQAQASAVVRFATALVHTPAKLAQALRLRLGLWQTPYWRGAYVTAARGGERLEYVTIRRQGRETNVPCDRLGCAYGLLSNTEVAAALGCRLDVDAANANAPMIAVDPWQATSVGGIFAAGECTGVGGMELAAVEGRIAAHAALGQHNEARRSFPLRERYRQFAARLHAAFALDPALRSLAQSDTLLCRCEDVTFGQAAAHDSWRSAKLHTRCGMGPCQGKVCGSAAGFCFGWQTPGTQTQRPPFAPARIDTLMQGESNHS